MTSPQAGAPTRPYGGVYQDVSIREYLRPLRHIHLPCPHSDQFCLANQHCAGFRSGPRCSHDTSSSSLSRPERSCKFRRERRGLTSGARQKGPASQHKLSCKDDKHAESIGADSPASALSTYDASPAPGEPADESTCGSRRVDANSLRKHLVAD